jgi:2-iminobutanoate/2-iminopropanoate deaminase
MACKVPGSTLRTQTRRVPAVAALRSAKQISDSSSLEATPPPAIGPYRPVVRAGEWIICSGQLGLVDGELAAGVSAQLRVAITNLDALLGTEGAALLDVVKTTVFLVDMADFDEMNATYVECFTENRPARSAVAVAGLPRGAQVEIEAWAYRPIS